MNKLLTLLSRYAPADSQDAALADRIRAFIESDPACFERSNPVGHITGSTWIIDPSGTKALLVQHKKLNKWLQPGGHADGDSDILRVALREAQEETGIPEFEIVSPEIFDVDIHLIPAHGADAQHEHFDIRFALRAKTKEFKISGESHAMAWVDLDKISTYSQEESLLRMARKWKDHCLTKNRG
jgi:8-oxo-dGTP pyrophosphatase MutT (NUDIX family)